MCTGSAIRLIQQVIDQIIGFRPYLISFISKYCYDG